MSNGLLGHQPAWIIGALIGAAVGLIIFVVIPTLIRWVWHTGPFNEQWDESTDDQ